MREELTIEYHYSQFKINVNFYLYENNKKNYFDMVRDYYFSRCFQDIIFKIRELEWYKDSLDIELLKQLDLDNFQTDNTIQLLCNTLHQLITESVESKFKQYIDNDLKTESKE